MRRNRRFIRYIAAPIVPLVVGGTLLFAGPAAHAAVLDQTCALVQNSTTFSPGLTLTPQSVTASGTGTLSGCVSLSHPTVTSGTSRITSAGPASCLASTLVGTEIIRWNTGATSTLALTATIPSTGVALVFTGNVTAGLFKGDTVAFAANSLLSVLTGSCSGSGGVTQVQSTGVQEFTTV